MKISRIRGDTYADQFKISLTSTGAPANLSGCTFKMTLSTSLAPDSTVAPVYTIVGQVTDPVNGIVEFAPTADQANQVGNFFYDIEMHDVFGKIRTILMDNYTYTQDITK